MPCILPICWWLLPSALAQIGSSQLSNLKSQIPKQRNTNCKLQTTSNHFRRCSVFSRTLIDVANAGFNVVLFNSNQPHSSSSSGSLSSVRVTPDSPRSPSHLTANPFSFCQPPTPSSHSPLLRGCPHSPLPKLYGQSVARAMDSIKDR